MTETGEGKYWPTTSICRSQNEGLLCLYLYSHDE